MTSIPLEEIFLEHVPPSHRIFAGFFKDVSNADFLQSQLLGRNPDFEYALIDASSIISRTQILSAIFKALVTLLDRSLLTPNVHSEIVTSLSTSKNISEAYRRWGITPSSTKDLVVVKITTPPYANQEENEPKSRVWAHLSQHVKGRAVPLTDAEIATSTDWKKLKKYYKLDGSKGIKAIKGIGSEQARIEEMTMLVLGGMALRGL